MKIEDVPAPEGSLLAPYAVAEAHYVDCYECRMPGEISLTRLIRAFYTQPLFQAERLILRVVARTPSSDAQALDLAEGRIDRFAVWKVAERTDSEILLRERSGRTLSWLQAKPNVLRFGSVVVPVRDRSGQLTLGPVFYSLMGPHKIYSRALLSGAARRI